VGLAGPQAVGLAGPQAAGLALALALLAGCDGEAPPPAAIPCEDVGWDGLAEPVLTTWCTPCHAATVPEEDRRGAPLGVDFDTWAGAAMWADRIAVRAAPGGAMPPAGGMTDDERERLIRWAECGAEGSATPTPPDPCATRIEAGIEASDPASVCAEGANAIAGDLVIEADPGTALDCLCEIDGELLVSASVTLPNLERVGTLTVSAGAEVVSLPALASAGEILVDRATLQELGLDALQVVDGNLALTESTLPAVLSPPRLTTVGGNLVLLGLAGVETIELPRLESVGLDLWIAQMPDLERVFHTSDLELVGRGLRITENPELTAIEDFSFLSEVGGTLEIGGGGALASVQALFDLRRVEGDLILRDEPALEVLDAFPDLDRVFGEVRLIGLGVVDVDGFDDLFQVGGVVMLDNPVLAGWSAGSPAEVWGDVAIGRNPLLPTLPLLDGVTRIDGSVSLVDLEALSDLSGLSGLTSIGGDLEVSGTSALTDIDLDGLQAVIGSLRVTDNQILATMGMAALNTVSGDLTVENNPILPQFAVDTWLVGVEVGGTVSTSGNGG
jgi:hypothetical protein